VAHALFGPSCQTNRKRVSNSTELEHAIVTAHPFDLSGGKVQAAIKKTPAAAAYRKVIEANSEAQDLAVARGRMLSVAADKGMLPNAEHNPARDSFPCDYCEWKTRCQVIDKGNFDMLFPAIPESWKSAPPGVSEGAAA
jgi:hypothetical protein